MQVTMAASPVLASPQASMVGAGLLRYKEAAATHFNVLVLDTVARSQAGIQSAGGCVEGAADWMHCRVSEVPPNA